MCGRFNVNKLADALLILFGIEDGHDATPRYNIAPMQPLAAVRENAQSGMRELCFLRWGLIPHWAKDPTIGNRMINARAETAAEKPSFRGAMRYRRCLIPAHGYYEWKKMSAGKQPYNVRMKDGAPFAFAGLWEIWQGPDGGAVESCTILTTEPSARLRAIHHRMPVILPPEEYDRWLDIDEKNPAAVVPLLRPYPHEALIAVPVSPYVNNPKNDDPRCIEPVEPDAGRDETNGR